MSKSKTFRLPADQMVFHCVGLRLEVCWSEIITRPRLQMHCLKFLEKDLNIVELFSFSYPLQDLNKQIIQI